MKSTRCFVVGGLFVHLMLLLPASGFAQYKPTPFADPAIGERYHIEGALQLWNPPLDLKVKSESLGIGGSEIDATTDLGLTGHQLAEWRFAGRPAKKHKFRLHYLSMNYSGESTLHRSFIFNGQTFGLNLPITTDFKWSTLLLAYEYDFLYRDRWYAGFTLNSKFTKTQVDIASPLATEFALAQAPVPTIGGVARVYVAPNISVTADINGIKIPNSVNVDYRAHYFDFDLYGTVNFNDYVGAQVGYRSVDVGYKFKMDEGAFKMKGLYFGGVVRY